MSGRGQTFMHRRFITRVGVVCGVALVTLVAASVAHALLAPQPVITALGKQYDPAADQAGAHIAYDQNSAAHPNHWDVYVKSASGRVKVNPTGQGFVGGIDGTTLIFQQVINGQSNLRLYNLSSAALCAQRHEHDGVGVAPDDQR